MKRLLVILMAIGVMMIASIGTVSAQDQSASPFPNNKIIRILSEHLEIDSETLQAALQKEGATLTSVIEANGGDVASIQAAIVDEFINANPDADPNQVEERVSTLFDAEHPKLGEGGSRGDGRPVGFDQNQDRVHSSNTDQRHDRPGDSDQRHDRPRGFDQRHDRPRVSDQRHDRPRGSDQRHDRPGDSDQRHDRPGDSDQRHNRPGDSDQRHDRSPWL